MQPQGIDRQSIEEATREAEARSIDFNPRERATAIREMLSVLVPLVRQGKLESELRILHPVMIENYPELFKKIIAKQDLTPLNTMLSMLDKMAEGRISQHEASVIVGQRLVDRFVTPQLKGSAPDK
jgi:hypothetical protein